MNKIPTKEEIKKAYNISNDDFEILTSFPKEDIVKKKYGKLIKLSSIFGLNAWMLRSITGVILAIIFIPPKVQSTLDEAIEFWRPVIQYTYDAGQKIVQNIQYPKEGEEIKTIAILPKEIKFQQTTERQELDEYPAGTQIHLVSGTMTFG